MRKIFSRNSLVAAACLPVERCGAWLPFSQSVVSISDISYCQKLLTET